MITLFALALFVYFAAAVSEILLLLFMSAILGTYFSAVTDVIMRYAHTPRTLSLGVAFVGTVAGLGAIGALILPPVVTQARELLAALPDLSRQLERSLASLADRYPFVFPTALQAEPGTLIERVVGDVTGFVGDSFFPYITAGGRFIVELFSMVAMALYLARSPASYREGMIVLFPPAVRGIVRHTLNDLAATMRAWVTGQALAMTFLGGVTAIGLWLLNVPYALAFGAFTGLVAIVPFFGTVLSTILPAAFVLSFGSPGQAVAVLALGVGVHLVEANLVYPLIFEMRIQLPPVLTILAVLISATLLGVWGLIVAVPLLASIIVVIRQVLICEIYGDTPARRRSAVLVPTQDPGAAA